MELREVLKNFWVRPEAVDYVEVINESDDTVALWSVEIGTRGGQRLTTGKLFDTEKDARNHACYVLGVLLAAKD